MGSHGKRRAWRRADPECELIGGSRRSSPNKGELKVAATVPDRTVKPAVYEPLPHSNTSIDWAAM